MHWVYLPLPPNHNEKQDINFFEINLLQLDNSPVSSKEVERESRRKNINCVIESLVTGNREMYREHGSFNNFAKWAQKLLAWGAGAVILLNLRMLYQLYNYHAGLSRMKALARSYVLWPNIDRDIEQIVRNCQECQLNSNSSKKMPVHPWEWNGKCRVRLHLDYAGHTVIKRV